MIGYEQIQFAGVPWRKLHGAIVPLLPPHLNPLLTDDAAREFLEDTKAHLIRWEDGFESAEPTEWWHLVKDGDASIEGLPKKVRYLVRQGRERFRVARCKRSDILERGYDVYLRAYERYETFERRFTLPEFRRAVESMPEYIEFWLAETPGDGRMVAFAENVVAGDACFYSSMWFCPDALKGSLSYALIQAMNEHYLGARGFRYVSDGARNLSHRTNIHQFLQTKFGFRRAYCRLNVVYSRPVGALVALAYPFGSVLKHVPGAAKLRALLEQERIRRTFVQP
ncbi:GNAT family N-acetyltransferase [Luteimonas sp. 8-5]|uniref:GNAT family N-acetyltransferase n=1 Tax=Luteimonas sp. 8-5 TaxID=3039387 RepID=UPI00243631C1|nr:GNAT family N-acetyltransferase [Luteimonas sp. 8-5]MDG6348298.1 GNAT family N-acetyltransferase [Luteimonas sp. 8-5]